MIGEYIIKIKITASLLDKEFSMSRNVSLLGQLVLWPLDRSLRVSMVSARLFVFLLIFLGGMLRLLLRTSGRPTAEDISI